MSQRPIDTIPVEKRIVKEGASPRKIQLLSEAKMGLRRPMKETNVAVNRLRTIP